jgi:hypothetical protein
MLNSISKPNGFVAKIDRQQKTDETLKENLNTSRKKNS